MSLFAGPSRDDRGKLLEEANRARQRGKHTKAIELYRRVLVVEPRSIAVHARLAPLLAVTCQDLDAWTSYRLVAKAHLRAGRAEQALAVYKEATRMLPRQIDAWRAAARIEHRLGRDGDAFETLVEGRRWFSGHPYQAHAIALLRIAHDIAPWSHDVTLDLARLLARAQQRFEALDLLDQLATRPDPQLRLRVTATRFKLTGSMRDFWAWLRIAFSLGPVGSSTPGEREASFAIARSTAGGNESG